jgi:hypothetical protein
VGESISKFRKTFPDWGQETVRYPYSGKLGLVEKYHWVIELNSTPHLKMQVRTGGPPGATD